MSKVLAAVKAKAEALEAAVAEVESDLKALREQLADATTVEQVDAVLQPVLDRLSKAGQDPVDEPDEPEEV